MIDKHFDDFEKHGLEKYEYMRRMHEVHKVLYEYARYIGGTETAQIAIEHGEVIFTFLSEGVKIRMICIPYDMTSVPFTFLDFGSYEKDETAIAMALVKEGDVVLDVGANTGWFTLNWLKNVPNVTVCSFEPMPETFEVLVKNLQLNNHGSDRAFNYGLSNKRAEVEFYWDTERCGATSMVNLRGTDQTRIVKSEVRRLDDVFPTLGVDCIDFIKCDVEGAEKLVLDGGMETIRQHRPVIFAEMLRKWARKYDYHPNDIINMLSDEQYDCYVIHKGRLKRFLLVTEETVETNYLFLDRQKHAEMLTCHCGD